MLAKENAGGHVLRRWGLSLYLFLFLSQAQALIFGADDRREIVSAPQQVKDQSRSIAMMLPNIYWDKEAPYPQQSLIENDGVCPNVRYKNQKNFTLACTGFLISPRHIMTAGHCMVWNRRAVDEVTPQCEGWKWVFDFTKEKQKPLQSVQSTYHCKNVVYAQFLADVNKNTGFEAADIAIIELDREVTDRDALPMNLSAAGLTPQNFYMVGHPLGLPMKYTPLGRLLSDERGYWNTNIDAFQGNSGSPVFNQMTGLVEGVLVRAYPKYDYVETNQCYQLNRCSEQAKNCRLQSPKSSDFGKKVFDESWVPNGAHVQKLDSVLEVLKRIQQ